MYGCLVRVVVAIVDVYAAAVNATPVSVKSIMTKLEELKPMNNQEEKQTQDELLTVHEVADKLRVDDTTVRRWITNGMLEAIVLPHMGKRQGYRVRQSTLSKLLTTPTTARPTTNE